MKKTVEAAGASPRHRGEASTRSRVGFEIGAEIGVVSSGICVPVTRVSLQKITAHVDGRWCLREIVEQVAA